jgi:hypothetical protein
MVVRSKDVPGFETNTLLHRSFHCFVFFSCGLCIVVLCDIQVSPLSWFDADDTPCGDHPRAEAFRTSLFGGSDADCWLNSKEQSSDVVASPHNSCAVHVQYAVFTSPTPPPPPFSIPPHVFSVFVIMTHTCQGVFQMFIEGCTWALRKANGEEWLMGW